ncbi:SMC family ATPase [Yaniella flava]|uniref:Nuclease SbcCD subunit C n=1 Tax=Yaniella flava TaxID=287930 RepID=A0ABN2U6F0_9MICC
MRIHALTFQAIGPYAGQQHLAFAQLDQVGLFLLDGPTGAGKSTILDVITFALYGKADDERKNTELHSTLAKPGVAPTITLDVSFGSRRFVIDRVLQHLAPRRGAKDPDDVVIRQASIALTEIIEGESRQLTTRVDEAQQILRSVIGLSREQFTSVVLLPQGDFARFLKASSNDREAILRQLFNTHRFDEIGDYLATEAKKLRGAVEADSERRESLRAGLIQIAETCTAPAHDTTDPVDEKLSELSDEQLIEHVEHVMSGLETHARRRVEQSKTTLEQAQKRLAELQEQRTQIRDATDYRQRHQAHRDDVVAAKSARQQLTMHDRAKPVADAHRHFQTAQQQQTAAIEQWQHQLDVAQHDPMVVHWAADRDIFTVTVDEVAALVDGWKTVESSAIRAVEQLRQHEKTQATITAHQQQLTQRQHAQEQLTEQIAARQQTFETVREELEASKAKAEQLAGVEHTLETVQQQLRDAKSKQSAAKEAHTAQLAANTAEQARDEAKKTSDDALEHAQTLLRRRIEAAAGFLAEKLEDGQPCEVCGSMSHPAPAELHGLEEISNDAVKTAEDRATEARRVANEAEQTYQSRSTTLHELQTRAGGWGVTEADAAVATVEHSVATAQQNVTELAALRARIKEHETRVEALRAEQSAAEQQLTETTTQITSITTELEQSRAALAAALGAYETVEALRSAVEPAYRTVSQIVNQGADVSTAVKEQTSCADRVAEALRKSATDEEPAFDDADAATAHLLDAQTYREHDQLVRQWTTEHDRLEEKAGQPAVVAGLKLLDEGHSAPSEEALETARDAQHAAQVALSQANREHGSIQAAHNQARGQHQQLEEVSRRSAHQLATYEELAGLSDVVAGRGENSATMPLRSFVLAGWLEQVAANASERLTGMTGGRYELKHAVGHGGRGHAGLNLEVIDHVNDTVRNPSTLSGGETFMASLALALGLADAVQAQAGGVAMDTLFIDEGFGSLDAETLEDVMGVLDALQDDGRLIGLVSHVESMKQQIPHRIQVHKTQTGSSVKVIAPDLA